MNRYKKLINNSIIFTIGSFGSKIISFLMVPLYTHILSTSEYGTVDLMNTTVSLLMPLIILELGQAALRFTVDTKNQIEQNKIFSNITAHIVIVISLSLLALPILSYFNLFGDYGLLFIILLISRVVNNIYSEYLRGIGLVKKFAFNGILMTLVTVVSNIVLLVYFNFKVEGYIISMIIASLVSNLYLFNAFSGIERLKHFNVDKTLYKNMLKYSVPIIPNSAMWWIINSSTRYFILFFIGAAGNGLYAVASKIPSIISIATGIFFQAWQLSSFEEYESDSRDEFYTKTFNIYWVILFIIGSIILIILKPLLLILVEASYFISWQIVPILILAVIYQSFSTFLGTNYTASKETKGAFTTSIYAGIISLMTSIILIPTIGLIGAALSSAISFFAMFFIRLIDTQKYVKIQLNKTPFILTNVIFIVQTMILFITDGILLVVLELALFTMLLAVNKNILKLILRVFITAFNKHIKNKF